MISHSEAERLGSITGATSISGIIKQPTQYLENGNVFQSVKKHANVNFGKGRIKAPKFAASHAVQAPTK